MASTAETSYFYIYVQSGILMGLNPNIRIEYANFGYKMIKFEDKFKQDNFFLEVEMNLREIFNIGKTFDYLYYLIGFKIE